MQKKLEKLSSLKFKSLDKNELRQISGGYMQPSDPCAPTTYTYATYVTPGTDYVNSSDGGPGTDCMIA